MFVDWHTNMSITGTEHESTRMLQSHFKASKKKDVISVNKTIQPSGKPSEIRIPSEMSKNKVAIPRPQIALDSEIMQKKGMPDSGVLNCVSLEGLVAGTEQIAALHLVEERLQTELKLKEVCIPTVLFEVRAKTISKRKQALSTFSQRSDQGSRDKH